MPKESEVATLTCKQSAEFASGVQAKGQAPIRVAYEHRNHDLDPQLVWQSKDEPDRSGLILQAPLPYSPEKGATRP